MASATNKRATMLLAGLVLLMCTISCTAGAADNGLKHCSVNNFQNSFNTTHMQYTKEPVNREYAIPNDFKSLHCCAKGYRTIEWFKDGKPYPFAGLILYPEESNQTIYTHQATMAIEGNYTCVLRNETHKIEHRVELILKDDPPETPLATFEPQNLEEVQEGATARFYCEAFVGNLDLPDEKSEISWLRQNSKGVWVKMDSVEIVKREKGKVLGAILSLPNVRAGDYGDYLCRIEMANPTHRLEMKASLHISPTVARTVSNVHILTTVVAILAAFLVVLFICLVFLRRHHARRHKLNTLPHREQMYDSATIEMSFKYPSASTATSMGSPSYKL